MQNKQTKLEATLLFVEAFDSIHRRKMEQILLAYDLLKENVTAIMMLYKNTKSLLTGWRHRLLWHCCWCSARGYISPIFVYNLPRLHTSNVDRSNKRKWLYTKKRQEADDTPHKLLRTQTSRGISSRSAAFLFLIFVSTTSSSSWVNCPSLMSTWLWMIFVIGSSVTLGDFSSRFLKCSFHICSLSLL